MIPERAGHWDDVVVGAGVAGAVVAGRLAEDHGRRVLLLEAGPAAPPDGFTPAGTPFVDGFRWDLDAGVDGFDSRRVPYPVGRVVGGSSAVNGALALRGLPRDFDRWAAAGNDEWGWDQVLPWFVGLEDDADYPGGVHGVAGPVPVRRPAPQEYDEVAHAFVAACRGSGHPVAPDLNAGAVHGVGPVPTSSRGRKRVTAADSHLGPAPSRPGLTVWPETPVHRVRITGGRARSVEATRNGRPVRVTAGRITLAAGAVGTPAVMLRSGVGPAAELGRLGIAVTHDLPGVGENLAEHPAVAIWARSRPGACRIGSAWHQVMTRPADDLNLFLLGAVPRTGMAAIDAMLDGRPGVAVSAMLALPRSRGRLTLTGPQDDARPVIGLGLLSAAADRHRLMAGVRAAWELLQGPDLRASVERILVWTPRMVADEALLRSAVPRFVSPTWHVAGTARMGPAADPGAVVDGRGRVHGVDGLVVADASVLPDLPAAPPQLTCLVVAERVAAWLR